VLRLSYNFATETAMYDNVSHIAAFLVNVDPECILADAAQVDVAGCSHRYSSSGRGMLPINEPTCGAVSGAWLDQHCAPVTPGPFAFAARLPAADRAKVGQAVGAALLGHVPSIAHAKSLLQFLLK
jgi:hypothetical protein